MIDSLLTRPNSATLLPRPVTSRFAGPMFTGGRSGHLPRARGTSRGAPLRVHDAPGEYEEPATEPTREDRLLRSLRRHVLTSERYGIARRKMSRPRTELTSSLRMRH